MLKGLRRKNEIPIIGQKMSFYIHLSIFSSLLLKNVPLQEPGNRKRGKKREG